MAIKSFTDMAREIEEHAFQKLLQEYSGISFNKNDYKASKEVRRFHLRTVSASRRTEPTFTMAGVRFSLTASRTSCASFKGN